MRVPSPEARSARRGSRPFGSAGRGSVGPVRPTRAARPVRSPPLGTLGRSRRPAPWPQRGPRSWGRHRPRPPSSGRRPSRRGRRPSRPSRLSRPFCGRAGSRSRRGRPSSRSRRRSPGRRSLRPNSCVVTPGPSGRPEPMISMRSESARVLSLGASTATMVIPSISNSASALRTAPALVPSGSRPPSSTPRGSRAPAARQVHEPSGRALVTSISMRRDTHSRYWSAADPVLGLVARGVPCPDGRSSRPPGPWFRVLVRAQLAGARLGRSSAGGGPPGHRS